jgi:hypothetical protein
LWTIKKLRRKKNPLKKEGNSRIYEAYDSETNGIIYVDF